LQNEHGRVGSVYLSAVRGQGVIGLAHTIDCGCFVIDNTGNTLCYNIRFYVITFLFGNALNALLLKTSKNQTQV